MTIRELKIKPYKLGYGTDEMKEMLEGVARKLMATTYEADLLEVFNMGGEVNYFQAGGKKRLITFINASPIAYTTGEIVPFYGVNMPQYVIVEPSADFTQIKSPEGNVIALFSNKYNELYVLADIVSLGVEDAENVFGNVIEYLLTEILNKKDLETSWKFSPVKDQLIARFKKRIEDSNVRILRDDKDRLRSHESNLEEWQRQAKNAHDNIQMIRRRLESAEQGSLDAQKKVVDEMDAIANHDRVSDLRVEDGEIVVSLDKIIAHDKNDRSFYIGNFKVRIKLETSEVRFFGDNPRRSYWTERDPHPHVNGGDGRACLGNVSQTIAELCSYNELYALVLTCLDFLENANIEDSAGKYVTNWDRVNESGNVIHEADGSSDPEEDTWECDHCGEDRGEDDTSYEVATIYDGDGNVSGHQTWCTGCREEDASWVDQLDMPVHDEIVTEVRNYFEEA